MDWIVLLRKGTWRRKRKICGDGIGRSSRETDDAFARPMGGGKGSPFLQIGCLLRKKWKKKGIGGGEIVF